MIFRFEAAWRTVGFVAVFISPAIFGATSDIAVAADVEITTNTPAGVNLDGQVGSTVHVAPGVAVGTGGGIALRATLQAWSLSNDGILSGGNTVVLTQGGSVTNAASGSITGINTAIILGTRPTSIPVPTPGFGPGTVDNYGTITGGGAEAVTLFFGGTVTNYAGATISTATGLNAVSIGQGTSRTLINSGTISATRSSGFTTGVLLQGGPSTFTNNATGIIYGDYNGLYSSSTTPLTFSNAGTIGSARSAAVEATAGGTFVNSGTIASSGNTGILIRDNANADITNSGTISGAVNAISFANTGGAVTAAVHTLRLQTGSILNGNVLGGANTDNLVLLGSGTESIAKFIAFETLSMQGTDWTLNGIGNFSVNSTVQAGTLRIAGQLATPALGIQAGGTLTGNGSVIGTVTNAGNVQVDAGTLTINGNYVQQVGSTLTIGVTPSSNGALAINGAGNKATLNGGTVRVMASLASYALNTDYTILTASGGRTGTFDGVTSNFAFLSPTLSYDPNNVYLALARNSADFATVGNTPNQRSAGRGLELLGIGNPIVNAALFLTPDQARSAFDSLSGEIHPSLHALLMNDSALLRDAILGRQRQPFTTITASAAAFADDDAGSQLQAYARAPVVKAPKWPIKAQPIAPAYATWVQGYGNWTRLNDNGNAAALRAASGGAIGGLDVTINGNWRFGLATGGGRSDMRVDARASTGTIDTVHVAGYAGGGIGDIALRAGAAYAHHDISTSRNIGFPGFAAIATASYGANTTQIFGEAAYRLSRSWLAAEAFADLAHVRISSDSFTEAGGLAALSVGQTDTSNTFSTLGLRGEAPLPGFGTWATSARGSLGWQHAFEPTTATSWMAFATSPTPFGIAGAPIARDALLVEAGLDALIHRDMQLSVFYMSRFAADADSQSVKAQVAVKF